MPLPLPCCTALRDDFRPSLTLPEGFPHSGRSRLALRAAWQAVVETRYQSRFRLNRSDPVQSPGPSAVVVKIVLRELGEALVSLCPTRSVLQT